ncbi:hypothetical protein GCM10027598_81440 [Amycolatopsis oliviviridis]|uniref:Uncharacterized protein n=1 Tax=Amycolatopsis oliviviridis TaxID=1471590 RepID=A0ABQ3L6P8_9PSEU|nr:hypothetical protein GCM10017790_11330 [Amycolatopsis oliviviridis]
MKVEFPRLSRVKGAFTRARCDCWCLWGERGDRRSVKASLRDPESLKEAFTDRATPTDAVPAPFVDQASGLSRTAFTWLKLSIE